MQKLIVLVLVLATMACKSRQEKSEEKLAEDYVADTICRSTGTDDPICRHCVAQYTAGFRSEFQECAFGMQDRFICQERHVAEYLTKAKNCGGTR